MLSHALLVAVASIACYGVYQFIDEVGLNGRYYKHHPGVCRRVPGIEHGSEDIHVMSDGKAFISSGFLMAKRMKEYAEKHDVKGRLVLFDFTDPSAGVMELALEADRDFHGKKFRPHGISVLEDKRKGKHLVYVINHPDELPDVVEKFRFSPASKRLVHLRSIPVGDKMTAANDLTLVAEDQFYITNTAVYHSKPFSTMERFLPLRTGGVFFYNGTDIYEAIPNLSYPNGIFLSPDHKLLYVLSYVEKTLLVYRLSPGTKGAELMQTVQLYGRGDNIQLSQSGDALLVGAHPNYYTFYKHFASPTPADVKSPSSLEHKIIVLARKQSFTLNWKPSAHGKTLPQRSGGAWFETRPSQTKDFKIGIGISS
ncbi:serum paraoxonase/arylesterase [Elysia marginata]|uniref:Paraoxonase n=1 Tax=Elysia marginata TaxID=1093978 RepID=A0AAV4I8F9_9GAST|nr:serum paraoxonase/arylesterase [Elysia marginata]